MRRRFCECCDVSVFKLIKKPLQEQLDGTDNLGVKSMLQCIQYDELDEHGKELFDWCIDFLIFYKSLEHSDKYIALWSFVYDFLKIPQHSGYDYYVMSFLEWNGVCEHGSGIRCAWLADDMGRKLSDDRRKIIKEWADKII
jgi:hypothetical protein